MTASGRAFAENERYKACVKRETQDNKYGGAHGKTCENKSQHYKSIINEEREKSFDLGLFLLDQTSAAVDGALFLPITLELTQQYLAAPEWQKHHAAMITLSMIAEGCSEVQ
jgi:formylmethanofuran dehydrogenase subunit A